MRRRDVPDPTSPTTRPRPGQTALEERLLRKSHVTTSSTDITVLVIGPVAQRTNAVAARLARAFGCRWGEEEAEQAEQRLCAINAQILAQAGTQAGLALITEPDLVELGDLPPYREAAELVQERRGESGIAILTEPSLAGTVPFWQAVASKAGDQSVVALVVATSPLRAGGGAYGLLAWLQSILLAERATRGLANRKVVLDTSLGEIPEDCGEQWIAQTWNIASRSTIFPPASDGASPRKGLPFRGDQIIGFNSWIRRCEAALGQWARQGESEALDLEFDRIRSSLDAALALFGPILGDSRLTDERLRLQNERLREECAALRDAGAGPNDTTLGAQRALLEAQAAEHEARIAQAHGDLTHWKNRFDALTQRDAHTQFLLLDTRLKLGTSAMASARMEEALIAHAQRQMRLVEKPLVRWISRKGWGFKAARRLAGNVALIEAFLNDLPWPLLGIHPDGRRRRILAYLTGASDVLPDFPFVRDLEYEQMYPDVTPSGMRPLVHFIRHGQGEMRNPHPLFDSAYYLVQCPEARQLASSPVVHYLRWGKDKGHDPHPLFSTRGYLQRYSDVASSGCNPLAHWLEFYFNIADSLFDARFYLECYPDVADAGRNPLTHYLAIGWREGRNPNPWFDTRYYLSGNPQVAAEGVNPLVHYATIGWRQRLRPGPAFDPQFYLAADPGLGPDCDPLRHYIEHGLREGRAIAPADAQPVREPAQAASEPAAPAREPQRRQDLHPRAATPAPPARSSVTQQKRVVLMVEALYPRPDLDSGSLDHVNFARIFQRLGYEVHYLSLLEFGRDHDEHSGHYRSLMEGMGVHCITSTDHAYFEGYYFDVADRLDACFVSRVHFGGMQIESLRRLCPDARIIFNTVDLHFVREEREGALKNDPALVARARQTREMELEFAVQADATVVVSSSEKILLDELAPEARTHVVPLIRQFTDLPESAFSKRRDIAFVGGFNHQPNIDAIEHFLADVWPHVRRRRPDIGFRVIGANMPKEWARRKEKGVTFVGFVEDLEAELATLRMTVAPLRYGAGAKGKLVSSLAAGVPAVVSAIASEGMGLIDGETVLVADGGEMFAEKIIALYDDEALWTTLSDNGANFIRSRYSIDTGYEIMRDILTQVGVTPPVDTKQAG